MAIWASGLSSQRSGHVHVEMLALPPVPTPTMRSQDRSRGRTRTDQLGPPCAYLLAASHRLPTATPTRTNPPNTNPTGIHSGTFNAAIRPRPNSATRHRLKRQLERQSQVSWRITRISRGFICAVREIQGLVVPAMVSAAPGRRWFRFTTRVPVDPRSLDNETVTQQALSARDFLRAWRNARVSNDSGQGNAGHAPVNGFDLAIGRRRGVCYGSVS